jgi:hypothetical protein
MRPTLKNRLGFWCAVCVLALGLPGAAAQDAVQHEIAPVTDSNGSVSLESFATRLDGKATEYQQKYPNAAIARTIDDDVAFPIDAAEFKAMNGYAVMLVSASMHDQSELPLAKVYLDLNGKSAELPVIARASRAVPAASPAGVEFGLYREDVFVAVPAIFLFVPASFGADFALHRTGFDFTKGPMTAPAYLAADKSLLSPQIQTSPTTEAFKTLIRREYPGFLDN